MKYVSMVDTFFSGWGKARNKKNVLIFECENLSEAKIVADNAKARNDQEQVQIHDRYPEFSPASEYYVQHKDRDVYPSWYVPGYFAKQGD